MRSDGGYKIQILTLIDKTTLDISTVRPNARAQFRVWFVDGKSIAISGRVSNQQGIWRIPIDGSDPRKLQFDASDITEVRLSEDDQRVAFTRLPRQPVQVFGA